MLHIKEVKFNRVKKGYPDDLPFFDNSISFNKDVTILVGENGSGKSTLLKIIKEHLKLYEIGAPVNKVPDTSCEFKYNLKKPGGIYFSSEDFTTYIYELEKEKKLSRDSIRQIDETYKHRSDLARSLAKMPHNRTLEDIRNLHDRPLHESSHGQAYLSFFKSRIRENQLILLDEPETPLSFNNQLALLLIIQEAVSKNNQLIIASHSPIIMSYPGALIYQIYDDSIKEVDLEEVESMSLMKSFLNNPNYFLRHLF